MRDTAPVMDLMIHVHRFLDEKQRTMSRDLAEKYGVPEEDVRDAVSGFLGDTYGPALELAAEISGIKKPVMLFVHKADCAVCKRSLPVLDEFVKKHHDIILMKVDYSDPAGVIYHMLSHDDKGLLPLIAMIYNGSIGMVYNGECIHSEIYEKSYVSLRAGCGQNIYAR